MATESLIVMLDADTAKLDKGLDKSGKKLSDIDKETQKADKSFSKLTKTASAVGSALNTTAVAGLALATALTTMVVKTAESEQQLAILSRQAKLSTTDFEALAFATKQYGIDAEQIADISKDLADKLGEFGKVGTGAFQDYADVIGLTKEEAQAAAVEFENMSSDQVIGEMVKQLEAAGASANEMTFVLESMGNDLSRLTPLFTDNGKQLDLLTSQYKAATGAMKLTTEQINALSSAATTFDLLTDSLREAGGLISATLAPLLDEFFGDVIKVVPEATQAIVDFFNQFKDAKDINSISSIDKQVKDVEAGLAEMTALQGTYYTGLFGMSKQNAKVKEAELAEEIALSKSRYNELMLQRAILVAGEKAIDEAAAEEEVALKEAKSKRLAEVEEKQAKDKKDINDKAIEEIENRNKTDIEILQEKLNTELAIVGENEALKYQLKKEYQESIDEMLMTSDELRLKGYDDELAKIEEANALKEEMLLEKKEADLITEEEYYAQLLELQREFTEKSNEIIGNAKDYSTGKTKESTKETEDSAKGKAKSEEIYAGIAMDSADALFENDKAVQLGLIVAKTAAGVMNQFESGDPYTAFARAAAVAATGVAQLASATSAQKGGGSTTAPTAPANLEDEREPEVIISETNTSGQSSDRIAVTPDDIVIAFNQFMNDAKTSGVI